MNRNIAVETKFQYERSENRDDDFQNLEQYLVRRTINQFTIIGPDNKPVFQLPRGPIYNLNSSSLQATSWRNQLKFDKEWNGTQHRVNVIAGTELNRAKTDSRKDRYHNYDKQKLTYNQIDAARLAAGVPGWNGQTMFYTPIWQPVYEKGKHASSPCMRSGSYTFDDRYIFSASGRMDKSNLSAPPPTIR